MSAASNIEWTDATWNPVRGCSRVSPGCVNCYAERQAVRHAGPGGHYEGLVRSTANGPRWTGVMRVVPEKLDEPLRWKTPQRIFVNSMSDLFHEDVPFEFVEKVFLMMATCGASSPGGPLFVGLVQRDHVFQVLTKRPARMLDFVLHHRFPNGDTLAQFPLPNVWLGGSTENQEYADERIPIICELGERGWNTMLSVEPLLGAVRLPDRYLALGVRAWVIVGGESGPGARPLEVSWVRSIVEQCRAAGTACFVKQLGAHVITRNDDGLSGSDADDWQLEDPVDQVEHNIHGFREDYQGADVRVHLRSRKGGDPQEWPPDLRVREFPAQEATAR